MLTTLSKVAQGSLLVAGHPKGQFLGSPSSCTVDTAAGHCGAKKLLFQG